MSATSDDLGLPDELPHDRPFRTRDAVKWGVSRHRQTLLIGVGTLREMARGTLAWTGLPDTVELRAQALGLVMAPGAIVTDRTAAWLHGVSILPRSAVRDRPPDVQCFSARHSRLRRHGVGSGTRSLTSQDLCTVAGLRVTTPLRTALDLGRLLWRYDALAALDGFARLGVTSDQLWESEPRFKGMRGVIQLRGLIPVMDGGSESPGESASRLHWIEADLPPPTLQVWVHDDSGRGVFRLDIADEATRFAAEYDGEEFHGPERTGHDAARRRWLEERGWTIVVLTKRDVYDRQDASFTLRAAYLDLLRRRGLTPLTGH